MASGTSYSNPPTRVSLIFLSASADYMLVNLTHINRDTYTQYIQQLQYIRRIHQLIWKISPVKHNSGTYNKRSIDLVAYWIQKWIKWNSLRRFFVFCVSFLFFCFKAGCEAIPNKNSNVTSMFPTTNFFTRVSSLIVTANTFHTHFLLGIPFPFV